MTEVLRVIAERAWLQPVRPAEDPVVLRGVTLVPRHGVPVLVERRIGSRHVQEHPNALQLRAAGD